MKYLILMMLLAGCATVKAGEDDTRYIGGCVTPMGEQYSFKNVHLKPFGSGVIIEDVAIAYGNCFFTVDDEKTTLKFFNSEHINWIKRPDEKETGPWSHPK